MQGSSLAAAGHDTGSDLRRMDEAAMTTTLNFGVVDLPYANAPRGAGEKRTGATVTTGDVAGFLEDRYHVMELFWEIKQDDIVGAIERSWQNSADAIAMGAPLNLDPSGAAMAEISTMFHTFISTKQLDGIVPGVPTQASLEGVSHRFKKKKSKTKKKKNKGPRPSFYDTGLYLDSFVAFMGGGDGNS